MNLGQCEAADNASTLTAAAVFATIPNCILFILPVISVWVLGASLPRLCRDKQMDPVRRSVGPNFKESQTSGDRGGAICCFRASGRLRVVVYTPD